MAQTIEIKDIGTIKSLVFDLPDDSGGVLVLKGRNRVGKSTAIRVLRALLSGNGRGLPVRDKAVRGSAEAFGKRASVGANVRLTGDLNVESLEGKFDFSDLVHPEAKDPETRDRIRIKALLSLTGAEADPSVFYDLVGGKEPFEKLVPAESAKKKDLVELAGMVHRALHAEAKKKESEAEFSRGHAQACQEAAGCVEIEGTVELTPLHEASSEAAAKVSALDERIKHSGDNSLRYETTQRAIDEARANYQGQSIEAATHDWQQAEDNVRQSDAEILELERALIEQKLMAGTYQRHKEACGTSLHVAKSHYSAVANLEAMLVDAEEAVKDRPSQAEYQAATEDATKARAALELGVKLRDSQQKLLQAKAHEDDQRQAEQAAAKLREAARSVDHVLSQKLPTGPLRAEAGRLVLDTERGEGALYDECSAGEAWIYALPYGIDAVGKGGVLAVQQEAWDGLDNENRQRIAACAKDGFCWILTAEVDDGELRAEVFAAE